MAKAKILSDRVVITSEILTDENMERVEILAPSKLKLFDEKDEKVLYEVANSECNTFSNNGAIFKDGKTIGTISTDEEDRTRMTTILSGILTRINVIEDQVSEYLEDAEDLSDDIEFID